MNILNASCNDCHSGNTNYQWYHKMMPAGWRLDHPIQEGKEHLNFSEFSTYDSKKKDHKLEEIAEEEEEHAMPLSSYTFLHPEAALTPEERKLLLDRVKTERAKLGE